MEKNLQTQIIKYLKSQGAVVDNVVGNEFQSNIADLLVCYKGQYIALEAKAPNGVLSKGQRYRLIKVQKAGGIGEVIYSLEKVKNILKTIDEGQIWVNTNYEKG